MSKIPNHTIADAADAALNVALVLIDNKHYYADEVFIRELHSRGYVILPKDGGILFQEPEATSPDKRGN